MAVQPFGDTASKPVGLTDDSEAEAPSEGDEDGDEVEAEEEGDDKRHTGSSTNKKTKKKERGMKEREEEGLEEEDVKSKRKKKGKDKKKKTKKTKKTNNGEATEIKKEKKRKKHSSAGSSRGSLQRECAEVINIGSTAAESAADDDDDDWEHNSAEDEDGVELDEITEAEFREVIAAIQRVRLTTLQRLGQARSATQALNEAAAARLSGFGDVGDATTGRHTYAMDWDKAVKAYRRHVSPVVVDIDGDAPAQGPTTTTASTSETKRTKRRDKATTPAWRGSRRINPRWEKIASYNLGLCYFNGEGIAQNITVAAQLFQRAADLGYINGINSLGMARSHHVPALSSDTTCLTDLTVEWLVGQACAITEAKEWSSTSTRR
jgi:hypothetical protein